MATLTEIKEVVLRQLYQVCLGAIKDWGVLYFTGTSYFRNAVEKCHAAGCSGDEIKAQIVKARRDFKAHQTN